MDTCQNQPIRENEQESFRVPIATVSSSGKEKMILEQFSIDCHSTKR